MSKERIQQLFSRYGDVAGKLEVLSRAYTLEFFAAKRWADELSRVINMTGSDFINEVVNKAMSYGRIQEYYQHTENSLNILFDEIEATGQYNEHVQVPFLSNKDEKIIKLIENFRETCINAATQKGLKPEYVNRINSIIGKIIVHYKGAKMISVAISDRETNDSRKVLSQIFKALSSY